MCRTFLRKRSVIYTSRSRVLHMEGGELFYVLKSVSRNQAPNGFLIKWLTQKEQSGNTDKTVLFEVSLTINVISKRLSCGFKIRKLQWFSFKFHLTFILLSYTSVIAANAHPNTSLENAQHISTHQNTPKSINLHLKSILFHITYVSVFYTHPLTFVGSSTPQSTPPRP